MDPITTTLLTIIRGWSNRSVILDFASFQLETTQLSMGRLSARWMPFVYIWPKTQSCDPFWRNVLALALATVIRTRSSGSLFFWINRRWRRPRWACPTRNNPHTFFSMWRILNCEYYDNLLDQFKYDLVKRKVFFHQGCTRELSL